MIGADVVAIVRSHKFHTQLSCQTWSIGEDRLFNIQAMILNLDVEIFTEQFLVLACEGPCLIVLSVNEVGAHNASGAGRCDNKTFLVSFQNFKIDARPVVVTFRMAECDKLDQVPVAFFVFRKQQEMVVITPLLNSACSIGCRIFVKPCSRSDDISFASNDRFDPCLLRLLVELHRTVHNSMIGERDRSHLVLDCGCHQCFNSRGTIQETVMRVIVKVDELRHVEPGKKKG